MLRKFTLILFSLVLFGCELPPEEKTEKKPKDVANSTAKKAEKTIDKGDFKVGFAPAKKAKNKRAEQLAKEDKAILQPIADDLNKTFSLPYDVFINFSECGEANAFYGSDKKEITICYELIDDFYDLFQDEYRKKKDLDKAVDDAVAFTFFHELGHALIDVWDLPTTGREEDAVDQLSTLILLDGTPEGEDMAVNGALSFGLESDGDDVNKLPFWDEHSFNQQRYYDILCLTYGSNPSKNKDLVGKHGLPKERAEICQEEFNRADKAWSTILDPYLK